MLWVLTNAEGKRKDFKSERQAKKYLENHPEYTMTSERQADDNILQVKISAIWVEDSFEPEITVEQDYVNVMFENEFRYIEDGDNREILMYRYFDLDGYDKETDKLIKDVVKEMRKMLKDKKKADKKSRSWDLSQYMTETLDKPYYDNKFTPFFEARDAREAARKKS